MHIIIEGPDCSGKTSLALNLAESYGLAYHHEGPPPTNINTTKYYCDILKSLKKPTVIDRFALGERVYGPLLRGKDTLGKDGWMVVENLISTKHIFQITCTAPRFKLYDIYTSRQNEERLTALQFWASIEKWEELCHNTYVYDYTQRYAKDFLFKVLNAWDEYDHGIAH